ncbi:hypothetical protein SAMN05421774_11254 [Gemmobacter megaterium]|uniref:Uncharacterized protein n=1 Tax=Gemmobacter megaterium TaxID=1086013 RepID=A0A1N7QIT6_9RHOB|nr:hypothetical protein [Gemmobacter megaterium]GGE26609.1 hypothetical protein GCM10011345_35740 [Gemmobacter megaterium]SIT22738.1 hypothetical protein SAMN05421774_11254 [Gemmobacter megaterium]
MLGLTGDVRLPMDHGRVLLRLDFNALCAFEAETGLEALPWIAELEAGRVKSSTQLRAMVWAAMLRHDPGASVAMAGAVLDRHPDAAHRAIGVAMPQATGAGDAPAGKKPGALPIWRRCFGALSRPGFRRTTSGP